MINNIQDILLLYLELWEKWVIYVNKESKKKYISKPYDTPTNIGIKWQMDVKYVPKSCYIGTDE